MANRPVFAVGNERNLCQVHQVEFLWYPGLSKSQKMKSSLSLRESFLENRKGLRALEVSRYSDSHLGMALSAFNLTLTTKTGKKIPVECAFQGSKIMKEYGQLSDLYDASPMEAKKDPRRSSGTLVGFKFDEEEFALYPTTAFYNWIYIRALQEHPECGDELMEYDAFVDIAFNPQKSKNCQAEACAYYVALRRLGLLEEAMKDRESFLRILYHVNAPVKEEKDEKEGRIHMKGRVWTEEMIREELARIDKKFDLHLNDLPIRFGKAKSSLGKCALDHTGKLSYFYFSKYYMDDLNFPDEEKLDTIRHEAAHAKAWLDYGHWGHGPEWKACCRELGANPQSSLNKERVNYFRERHEQKEAESEMCDFFITGMGISHPKYGQGHILKIEGENEKRTLLVEFANHETKKMSAVWVFANCEIDMPF